MKFSGIYASIKQAMVSLMKFLCRNVLILRLFSLAKMLGDPLFKLCGLFILNCGYGGGRADGTKILRRNSNFFFWVLEALNFFFC